MALIAQNNPQNLPNYQNQQITANPIFAWANSQEEGERLPLPANTSAIIMNRNEDVFYIRRKDAYGNSYPTEIYDFTKRVVQDPNAPVGREEFNQLTQMVSQIVSRLDAIGGVKEDAQHE